MPFMVGCSMWQQCKVRQRAGAAGSWGQVQSQQAGSSCRLLQRPLHTSAAAAAAAVLQGGQADGASPYCHLSSLVADICGPDEMHRVGGCGWLQLAAVGGQLGRQGDRMEQQ